MINTKEGYPPTPAGFIQTKIKSQSEYKLNFNNQNYLVKISLSNKITINLEELDTSCLFSTDLTLEEFHYLNKIFKQYDTLEECYKYLIIFFGKNKVNIDKEDKDEEKIYIKLPINSAFGETEEINIPLIQKQSQEATKKKLNKEIFELKNKIIFLEKENKELKNTTTSLQNELKDYKKLNDIRLTKLESNLQNQKNYYNIDTRILSPFEDITFLTNRLKKYFKENTDISFNLIYRASVNGDEPSDFHYKCDFIKNVLVLYYTSKFVKFGGFTSIGFDSSNCSKDDPDCFIFNINNKKIYEAEEKNQVGCYEVNGPFFGRFNSAIYLYDGVNLLTKNENQHKTSNNVGGFKGLKNNNFVLNNGEEYFSLLELEVFEIK